MTWASPLDAFAPTIDATGGLDYTPEQIAAVEDVLDAAQAARDGALPLAAFARIGTLIPPSWSNDRLGVVCRGRDQAGYSRWKALIYARKTRDPRFGALLWALNAMAEIERSGVAA